MSEGGTVPERPYVLGAGDRELDRLDLQGRLYRSITLGLFVRAGIGPGMRVLDVGCGSGDVSLLVGELVGPDGAVLGVDREASTVEAARARAARRGARNVSFGVADFAKPPATGAFDALVGRFVLMHQPDPAAALAGASTALRPGGVVAFVESSMSLLRDGPHSHPHSALYDDVVRWKCAVVGGAGAHLDAGMALRSTFLDAGLTEPECRLEASLQGGAASEYYRYVAESVRSMLPAARRLDVAGHDADSARDLEERLRAEVVTSGGVLVAWPVVTAWCRGGRDVTIRRRE